MARGELEIGHSGSGYTTETGKCYRSGLCIPGELSFKLLSARHSVTGLGLNQILDLGQVMPPLQVSAPSI